MKPNFCAQILVVLIFIGIYNPTFAQEKPKLINWGLSGKNMFFEDAIITIGVSQNFGVQNFRFSKNEKWNSFISSTPYGQFSSISGPISYFYGVGIPLEVRINPILSIISTPTINIPISGPYIKYNYLNSDKESSYKTGRMDRNSGFNSLNLPLLIKFKLPSKTKVDSDSNKYLALNKMTYYLSTGLKYTNYLGSSKYYNKENSEFDHKNIDPNIILKSNHYTVDIGLGLELYFKYFKMSPEIRFSQSLGNLLDKTHPNANLPEWPNPFMNAIDRLSLRSLQFSLIFQ